MIPIAAVLLTLGALLFTLFVRKEDLPEPPPASPFEYLDELKARIYENLRDLTFEFRLGKLSEEDYQKSKKELQRELAGVMAQIDQLKGVAASTAPAQVAAPAAKIEGTLCPHCGAKFPQPLKFCGECGKPMSGGAQ